MSKPSFADVMASNKNGRRKIVERVCFSADLAEEYHALSIEYAEAKRAEDSRAAAADPDKPSGRRLNADPESVKVLKKLEALIGDNSDAFYDVEFEQARDADWRVFRAQHAPRDDDDNDRGYFNADTFPRAAVAEYMLDPEPTDEVLAYFDENLSHGEWDRLGHLIWKLNEGVRSVPKAEADMISLLLRGSEIE